LNDVFVNVLHLLHQIPLNEMKRVGLVVDVGG
jgi:hypothetical protein